MAALMDLVAGDERSILLAISVEDWAGLDDRTRFDAHLALGGGLDPTWLDLFSQAVRGATGGEEPAEMRAAVYGSTGDEPERHFLGWLGEVDPDELFDSGAAWGITVVRRAAGDGRAAHARPG